MKFGFWPFAAAEADDVNYRHIIRDPVRFWKFGEGIRHITKVNRDLLDSDFVKLLTALFSPDLTVRPKSISEVLSHPYFTNEDINNTEYAQE